MKLIAYAMKEKKRSQWEPLKSRSLSIEVQNKRIYVCIIEKKFQSSLCGGSKTIFH